ncbi:MAG TPA: Gldg family protein [Phototrophicaceae bacterium]|jgi:ABC-type uncharacterized transport system involved in gliding motility auxiliary subunit|nr:Gldg family protein [Phototrophicaceae bacterium]
MTETTTLPLRDRAGQYGSFIGAAGLLMAFIGWVWQGNITPAIIILFGIGAFGVLAWFILTPQEAFGLMTGRGMRYGTFSVLLTMLLIAIVVLVYILLQRAALTLDMTERQDFTLSIATTQILDRISSEIQITGFYSPRAIQKREIDDQIFRLYETYTEGKIKRVYYDPDQEPALAQKFGITQDADVFVSFLGEDGQVDFNSVAPVYFATNTERDMTTAIQRLLVSGQFKVYIETGYSQLNALDEGQQGLTRILTGLRNNGISVSPLDLKVMANGGGLIPMDASTLIMTRGNEDLSPEAINVLDDYLNRGGSLLIMTDAVFTPNPFLTEHGQFNQYLWDHYGIKALDAVVVDAVASGETQLDVGSYAVFPDLEIGSRLNQDQDSTAQFRIIRAIQVNTDPPVTNGQIVASSPQSYGETDLTTLSQTGDFAYEEGADLNGPFTLMAWAKDTNTGAKIILVGDTDFVTNGQVVSPLGNSILFTDAIGWLTSYTDTVSFPIQAFSTGLPLMFVSTSTLDQIAFLTVVVMPGLVLLAGLAVWVQRNRA